MTKKIDFYFSFRSPYSYLAIARIREVIEKFDLEASLKIVRPLALRESDFFEKARPQLLPYLLRDMVREAQCLSIPIVFPRPDPIIMDMESGKVATQQPYIEKIMRLGFAACALGKGFAYADAVSTLIWAGTENWHETQYLVQAAHKAGLEHEGLQDWANENQDNITNCLETNESEQMIHHWGVPLMVLDGEPFFGQDRIDTLKWRLEQK